MKSLRNIIILLVVTCLNQVAYANPEVAKAALKRLLDSYTAVETYRPTLGIELEGSFPGKTRKQAFDKVESIIQEKVAPIIHPGAVVTLERYSFKTARNEPRGGTKVIFTKKTGEVIVWEVKDDGSIKPTKKHHIGVEVVSPILHTESDVKGAETLIQMLAEAGFDAEPASAALQVHAGFSLDGKKVPAVGITKSEMTAQTLLLVWFFSKIEKEMMEHFKIHPDRAHFSKPTPPGILQLISTNAVNIEKTDLNEFIEKNYDYKYWALNVRALFRFGTFEIRFMNSTTDTVAIDQLVELAIAISSGVKTKNPALIKLMNDNIESEI
ncbi:MAG: amidoligase family protein, partial [Bdellovibrionota bacterium]